MNHPHKSSKNRFKIHKLDNADGTECILYLEAPLCTEKIKKMERDEK
jgi:hypothetical protein